MRKLFVIIYTLFLSVNIFAQSPQKMSYQCVVRNSGGALVTNQSVGIRISILQGSTSGIVVYQETYNPDPQTNANGLVSIEIGSGLAITGTFSGINWDNGPYYLKTDTDPLGGTNYTITGISQLLSVPYALYSKRAETSLDAVRTSGDQMISGNKTFSGITTIANPVNETDAATKKYVDDALKSFGLLPNNYAGTLTDIDGNIYKIVKIGTQTWMAENLRVVHYNDGIAIDNGCDSINWINPDMQFYCWYKNDAINKAVYGILYNWYTVETQKLCPTGWRIPNSAEWTTLEDYLGGSYVAGGKIKETGTRHWLSNLNGTNESGFTALPGGFRRSTGEFTELLNFERWWLSEELSDIAYFRGLISAWGYVERGTSYKGCGYSVRCIKN